MNHVYAICQSLGVCALLCIIIGVSTLGWVPWRNVWGCIVCDNIIGNLEAMHTYFVYFVQQRNVKKFLFVCLIDFNTHDLS